MGKQGTITAFFGPASSSPSSKPSKKPAKSAKSTKSTNAAKPSKSTKIAKHDPKKSNKRPRVQPEPSNTSKKSSPKPGLKRLKKLSDTNSADEDDDNLDDLLDLSPEKPQPSEEEIENKMEIANCEEDLEIDNTPGSSDKPSPKSSPITTLKPSLPETQASDPTSSQASKSDSESERPEMSGSEGTGKEKDGNTKENGDVIEKVEEKNVQLNFDVDADEEGEDDKEKGNGKKKEKEEDSKDEEEEEENEDNEDGVDEGSDVEEVQHAPPKKKARSSATVSSSTKSLDVSRLATKRTWKPGQPVPYKFVTEAFAKVEEITGRLEIQAILTQLLRDILTTTPEDLVPTIYLCINKLAPAHHGIELGIGESILLKALSQVTGRSINSLKDTYKKIGDLGDVASQARTKQKTMFPPPPLTVRKVYSELKAIAQVSGKNTQDAKRAKIVKMMVAASKAEAKYLARALLGKLRINLADKTVITALSSAVTLEKRGAPTDVLLTGDGKKKSKMSKKEEKIEEEIKNANTTLNAIYSQLPVWDVIVPKLLEFDVIDDRLVDACKLMPGVPVSPMLAKPTKAISEVLERFEEGAFTCEFKYDGERAQVHRLEDGSMKVYSRNAENLTPKYPDLVRDLPKALKSEFGKASFIIDAEAVAYDVEKKQILPFQELQGRKRKDVEADDVKVKVCLFAFDLLFFAGESLISKPFNERRKQLHECFIARDGQFMFAKGHDSRDPEQIMELLNESIKEGCEGLMVKGLEGTNSTYEPANRSQNWLKVKKDYLDGCGDSLDLVPIGGYIGRGKRTGTYGAFLLACYNPDAEEYQSICKIGTGFSEADLDNFAKFYDAKTHPDRISKSSKSYYRTPQSDKLAPDVWFEPLQVWEVKCADLSISPIHTAAVGHVDEEKGIALRFPRFIRIRDDKKVDDATSAEQVAEFYLRQSSVANQG